MAQLQELGERFDGLKLDHKALAEPRCRAGLWTSRAMPSRESGGTTRPMDGWSSTATPGPCSGGWTGAARRACPGSPIAPCRGAPGSARRGWEPGWRPAWPSRRRGPCPDCGDTSGSPSRSPPCGGACGRWRRPRLVAKGDPEAAQRWAAVRRALRQLPAHAVILAEDECRLDLLACVRATWIPRGQRQRVWTPGQSQRRSLFGALDIRTGAWWERVTCRANSREFIAFLEQLAAGGPTAPAIAVVLDNVIIHSSHAVQVWLAAHPRVHLLYGARSCPHANPVERAWGALKRDLANSAPPTMAGCLRQATCSCNHTRPDDFLQLAAPETAPWMPHQLRQDLCKAA